MGAGGSVRPEGFFGDGGDPPLNLPEVESGDAAVLHQSAASD